MKFTQIYKLSNRLLFSSLLVSYLLSCTNSDKTSLVKHLYCCKLPPYSRLTFYAESIFVRKLDSVIYTSKGQHIWEYYGQHRGLIGKQVKPFLVSHFFTESTGKNTTREPFLLFKSKSDTKSSINIYVDYIFNEIASEVEHPIKDYHEVLSDTNYIPNSYDNQGNHLCNIYRVNMECKISIYGLTDSVKLLTIPSSGELWTPYNFSIGKKPFDKLSHDERVAIFGND
ncbi:MAG: hypothetical protein RIS64_4331 [Bacteroidota bacterium]|jgi:hypothetical protein